MWGTVPRTSILRTAVGCGREVNRRGGKSLLCARNAMSLSSADCPFCRTWKPWQRKPGANCVNNPLQSRNSHAKLQTTPRPSEINRHAAGTTSLTCFECDAKSISRLSDASARNRCQPSSHAKRTRRRSTTRRSLPKPGGVPPAATSGTPDREHPL